MSLWLQGRMQDLPVTLMRAFRYFGGSVKIVLDDDQKAAALKNNNGKVGHTPQNYQEHM